LNKFIEKYKILLKREISKQNLIDSIKLLDNFLTQSNVKKIEINNLILSNRKIILGNIIELIKKIFNEDFNETKNDNTFIRDIKILILNNLLIVYPKVSQDKNSFKILKNFINNKIEELSVKNFYLGVLFEQSGDFESALKYFENSLFSSHSDDHEFMTLLQIYWGRLIEKKEYKKSLELLLKFSKRISVKNIDELNSIIRDTFDIMSSDINLRKAV